MGDIFENTKVYCVRKILIFFNINSLESILTRNLYLFLNLRGRRCLLYHPPPPWNHACSFTSHKFGKEEGKYRFRINIYRCDLYVNKKYVDHRWLSQGGGLRETFVLKGYVGPWLKHFRPKLIYMYTRAAIYIINLKWIQF